MSKNWRLFGLLGRRPVDRLRATDALVSPPATTARLIGIDDIRLVAEAFRANPSQSTAAQLRELLWSFAESILQSPPESLPTLWAQTLRPLSESLKGSGLRATQRSAREDHALGSLRLALTQGWNDPQAGSAALAGMLLTYAYELPIPGPLNSTPDWLRADWAAYLLEMPPIFNRQGDAAAYADHLLQVTSLFHAEIESGRHDQSVWELGDTFFKRSKFIQAYFNERNLRELQRLRGDIVARMLAWSGAQCAYALPPSLERRGRMRVGIYAEQLSSHTETFFTIAALDFLDREQFEVILYVNRSTGHVLEQNAASRCDRFVILPADALATQVHALRNDDLDVLLIGTNTTAVINTAALLGAHRLARVQIASESSPITTGLHAMDVMLSADWSVPADDAGSQYTELLYRMPGSNNVFAYRYDPDRSSIDVTRASLGLADDQIVFFSSANYYKVLPELSAAWARILARVPGSVLVLMPFSPNWDAGYLGSPFLARISSELRAAGVAPERLKVLQAVPSRADVQHIMRLADVYLDSYPFSGACSLGDALAAALPPVAVRGTTNRGAYAASMLRAIDMQEAVADSADAYVDLAVQLASDQSRRTRVIARLKTASIQDDPPYKDTLSYSQRVGAAFAELLQVHDDYYRGLAAVSTDQLIARIAALVPAQNALEAGVAAIDDVAINESLLLPYFRAGMDAGTKSCMLDVGACFGQIALPYLRRGWEVHMFEPDPDARATLHKNVAEFGDAAPVIDAAVSQQSSAAQSFHKARAAGLSGFSASPYGETASIIQVPTVRLEEYCKARRIGHIEFLKIDAEGHDFEALQSLDLGTVAPRIIMLDFGTSLAGQTLGALNQVLGRMKAQGYRSVIFAYDDDSNLKRGIQSYELKRIFVDAPCPDTGRDWFGSVVFFRTGDTAFLLSLHALLDSTQPRRAFLSRFERRAAA